MFKKIKVEKLVSNLYFLENKGNCNFINIVRQTKIYKLSFGI